MAALRDARGVKAVQLADQAGISRQHLSNIESGRRVATEDHTKALAEALGVAPEVLTGQTPIVRAIRDALGIGYEDLAQSAEVFDLAGIELGSVVPDDDTVTLIARRLGVPRSVVEPIAD